MADNSSLPVASGNETFANDDIGGVKYPRAKVALGADGTGVDWVGGSGANGTGVARVTIATDDTLMAAMSGKLPSALGAGGGLKVQMYNAAGSNVDPVAAGSAAMAGSIPVTLATDDTRLKQGLYNKNVSAAFTTLTRPANATPYSAGDSISDNATAGSVTALSATVSDVNDDPIFIADILINSTDTGLLGKKLRANLFNSNPTSSSGVSGGDNAAYSQKKAGYIGTFVGTLETGFSDGTVGRLIPCFRDTNYTPAGGFILTVPTSGARTLYIQFVAEEAFTPSANSTTIIATARGWQARAA